jgi:transcriptional regulator with XRE-family HTH domain
MSTSERFSEFFHKLEQSPNYAIEGLKIEIAEQIYQILEQEGVSKAELSKRLGTSRAYVTNILKGDNNFTLQSLADIAKVLGYNVDVTFRKVENYPCLTLDDALKYSENELPAELKEHLFSCHQCNKMLNRINSFLDSSEE